MLPSCTALKTPFFETVGYTVTVCLFFSFKDSNTKGFLTGNLMNSDTSPVVDHVQLPRAVQKPLYRILDNVNLC